MLMTRVAPASLIGPADPPPVEWLAGTGPVALVCEHAGRAVPAALGDLGLGEGEIARHIGWDIGAAAVTRALSARLDAPAVLQPYSRLVIDCNRPPGASESVPEVSDATPVPGNRGLSPAARAAREAEIFAPFQAAVAALISRGPRIILAIHSFTPSLAGVHRPWEVGFLHRADRATSAALAAALRARRRETVIGMNEPYRIEDTSDYFVPVHGEGSGIPHALIEIRNDLIADSAGVAAWSGLLAAAIGDVLAARP
ncbi:MAG: N-formylglutamate amidohydrolase [Pseudomonadota bacterium]